jgi:Subtilase family
MDAGDRTLFDGDDRRPLLAGGEQLSGELERPVSWGPKQHPRTVEEAVEILAPQFEVMSEEIASTPPELRGARMVIEAKILPSYLANSNFPKELFAEADLVPVGTKRDVGEYWTPKQPPEERETKSYLLAGDERSFSAFGKILKGESSETRRAEKAHEALRQFDLIRLPGPAETLRGQSPPSGTTITWEAVFHPSVNSRGLYSVREQDRVWEKWLTLINSLGGQVAERYRRWVGDLLFVPVRLPADGAEKAAAFNPLRTLRPMPGVRPVPVAPLRVVSGQAPQPPPGERPQSDLRVAVFDGGVDPGAAQLRPFVETFDLTEEDPDEECIAHGTLVTASVLFGADHVGIDLQTPEAGVDHYRVLPAPESEQWDLDLYWILDQIETQVKAGGHRIVNLSIGPDHCLEDEDEPHRWTAALDQLGQERDILFVTAVGNNGDGNHEIGADRIQAPADMVNGLGVGACDARPPQSPWSRASYSAVGPGRPGSRMQPAGVAFGGTPENPFRGVGPGGQITEAQGTSFAAPATAHGLAALAAQLGAVGEDPSVLRVFAAHFAEAPEGDPLHEEVGFGRFAERYDLALDCAANEATVLYCDEIERGQLLSLPFPLAEDVVRGRRVEFSWSIAFAAPTDPKDSAEYTQACLETRFRPHSETFTFTHRKTKKIKVANVVTEKERVAQLIGEGYSASSLPRADRVKQWRHETLRRQEDGKWETMHRASAGKLASSLLRPHATVLYLAREDGGLTSAPPLQFAMLLTMRTTTGVPLYDAVRSRFQVLRPLQTQIPLRIPA